MNADVRELPAHPAERPMSLEAFIDAMHEAAKGPRMRNVEVRANAAGLVQFTAMYHEYRIEKSRPVPFSRWAERDKAKWIREISQWPADWRQGRRG